MAYIPTGLQPQSSAFPNYDQLKTYLSGGGPTVGIPQAPQDNAQTQQSPSSTASPGGPPLSGQFSQTLTATQEQLQQMGSQFREQAGEGQSFDALGGGRKVDELLSGPSSNQDIIKSWLNASYQGPTGLDASKVGEVQSNITSLQGLAGAMKTPEGIANILQSDRPSYTPGEARFEAGYLRTDPGTRQKAAEAGASVQSLQDQLKRETETAGQMATQRQQQAGQLATDTRSYLSGKKSGLASSAEQEIQARKAEQERLAALYVNQDTTAPEFQTGAGTTETAKKRKEAEAKWAEIMAKYPDIAGYDPLKLNPAYHRKGSHALYESPAGLAPTPDLFGTPAYADPMARLVARQQELEPYFGFTGLEAGTYADVMPLYFGETAGAAPYSVESQPYMTFDPGTGASYGNVMSQDDIALYNVLAELLGTGENLTAQDYRAPSLGVDIEGLQAAENQARAEAARDPLRKWQNFAYGYGLS